MSHISSVLASLVHVLSHAPSVFWRLTLSGIELGGVYALIAIGYTLVYGVLQFINFAHGDVYMVGAYIGFFSVTVWFASSSPWIQGICGIVLSIIGCALLGLFIERLAYRPLRNGLSSADAVPWSIISAFYVDAFLGKYLAARSVLPAVAIYLIVFAISFAVMLVVLKKLFRMLAPRIKPTNDRLTALITAIGMSLLLENQGAASFGVSPHIAQVKGINQSVAPLIVLVASVVLAAALVFVIKATSIGRAIRAVSQDKDAAALMGIPTDKVVGFTFLLGAGLAGAGGFLNHMVDGVQFDTNIGITLGLKAFIAAVLGGIGRVDGAIVGALLMGLAETYTGASIFSDFKNAVAFVILIAVLLLRPSGILGKTAQEKV